MPIAIDADFPGGNIAVDGVDGDEIRVHQELRDTARDWFYWCFRVRGAQGRTLRFEFTSSRALGVRGPAVSRDGGKCWIWLGADAAERNTFFTYRFPSDAEDVRFSFAMPYQWEHWRRFADALDGCDLFARHELCTTRKGRKAEYALLGGGRGSEPRHRMAVTCRHHCCEMMVNYTLEGLIRWVIESDEAEARRMREDAEIFILPFADLDGVEDGDQGKGRQPRDHGRDYLGDSIYAETAVVRERLPAWGGERLHLGLDLHCPWIAGEHNEATYLVGSSNARNARQQRVFSGILESVANGPLPFSAEDYLPFGESWNTGQNTKSGRGFSRWVAELPTVRLGTAIEIPYANARGAEVNQDSARAFGQDVGRALSVYLFGR